jgi:cleavage stimulation factor subunit 3
MAQAYDFALEKIGMDIQSYSIWNDYVNFLKAVEAVGSYAENQKISAVRKVSLDIYCEFFCIMLRVFHI